jgi:transposase-like protein
MNPQPLFCLNLDCPSRGLVNAGNLRVHSSLEGRFRCHTCGATFASNKGTLFYRLKTDPKTVVLVLALLAYGCPLPAIVAAFGLDARTVANWQRKAGAHCKALHQHRVVHQPRDLGQVQADEIRAKMQKRRAVWMAMAIQVASRLWLGGVVSARRDKQLIWRLVYMVRLQALQRRLLLLSDGLASYVSAWKKAFVNVIRGKQGAPRRVVWPEVVIGQVIKRYEKLRAVGVEHRRLVQGSPQAFEALCIAGQVINTAYIERLNATFRQRLCGLVRRGRCLLRQEAVLEAGMYLVGCVYNFCTPHTSLRMEQPAAEPFLQRTPAMAAGITQEIWSVSDLLWYRIPPPPYPPPKPKSHRGRPKGVKNKPKGAQQITQ